LSGILKVGQATTIKLNDQNQQEERHDVHARAVEADVLDDQEFRCDEPEDERHRRDDDGESEVVNPAASRAPTPGRVEYAEHDVPAKT
jgi:hypothetical protein